MRWWSFSSMFLLTAVSTGCRPLDERQACHADDDSTCSVPPVDPPDDPPIIVETPKPTCPGACLAPVVGWEGPFHLATGSDKAPGACPAQSPELHTTLFAGFEAPAGAHVCPVCTCEASESHCAPPLEWHASTAQAPGDAGILTAFDAPAGWDGACTSVNAIPEGALCEGVPCVRSVAVGAPELAALPCAVTTIGTESKPAAGWGTVASSCVIGALVGTCGDGDGDGDGNGDEAAICAPVVAGVETCVQRPGEHACPAGYPVKHTFHEEAVDSRACAPCSCGAPVGGSCTAIALAYSDQACQAALGAKAVESGSTGEGFDVPEGTALGSKAAEVVAAAGSCAASGGEPTGTVEPGATVTVCCRAGDETRSR